MTTEKSPATAIVDDVVDPTIMAPYADKLLDEAFAKHLNDIVLAQSEAHPTMELTNRHCATIALMLAHSMFCRAVQQAEADDLISHQLLSECLEAGDCMNRQATALVMRVAKKSARGEMRLEAGTTVVSPQTAERQDAERSIQSFFERLTGKKQPDEPKLN